MSKQFYIKSEAGEWISLTGKEFYQFVNTEEGKKRYFFDFEDYVLEVSLKKYKEWRKEKDHSDYINETWKNVKIVSLHSDEISKFGSGQDVLCDDGEDIAEMLFKKVRYAALDKALAQLSSEEYNLINDLYLKRNKKTERQIAKKMGLSQIAIHKRKKKILKNLKVLVIKSEKSSQ